MIGNPHKYENFFVSSSSSPNAQAKTKDKEDKADIKVNQVSEQEIEYEMNRFLNAIRNSSLPSNLRSIFLEDEELKKTLYQSLSEKLYQKKSTDFTLKKETCLKAFARFGLEPLCFNETYFKQKVAQPLVITPHLAKKKPILMPCRLFSALFAKVVWEPEFFKACGWYAARFMAFDIKRSRFKKCETMNRLMDLSLDTYKSSEIMCFVFVEKAQQKSS